MNLLLETEIRDKIEEITGPISDLWLDILWESLTQYLGYDLSLGEKKDRLEGNNSHILYLVARPVVSLTEIQINDEEKSLEEFEILQENSIYYKNNCFWGGYGSCAISGLSEYPIQDIVNVTYQAGYTVEDFPNLLIWAITSIYQNMKVNTTEEGNLKSYKISDISYTFKTLAENNQEINAVLSNYMVASI